MGLSKNNTAASEDDRGIEKKIATTGELLKKQPRVKIIIQSSERDKGPVDVAINGYAFRIKRDEEVEVPEDVLKVLDNAIMKIYDQVKREDGEGMQLVERKVKRFPYTIVR